VLPGVMALDGYIAVSREVSEDETVTSPGWEAYINDQTGTNGTSGLNVETEGTALTLRAYAAGEYAYAVYGQAIGADPKPLKSLINSDPCAFGGGQDDDIPLSYFVGIADYSLGSWRWFGPFGQEDVMVTVNSETLKSRFKSPEDNFYLCVLASNGGKAASALPDEGLIADFPIEPRDRAVSEEDDPGGLTIEEICTWVEENLYTDPAVVTGLEATTDTSGVYLTWDTNLDPDVYIYQVLRDDLDDEDPATLLEGVIAPVTEYSDLTGFPGKEYHYLVRARNDAGFGGPSFIDAGRQPLAPTIAASDGRYEEWILVEWTEVMEAAGWKLYRADSELGEPQVLAELPLATRMYVDNEPLLGQEVWYWVRTVGEDVEGPLSAPDSGMRARLEPSQVTATDGAYPDRVELNWGADEDAESYIVYRGLDENDENPEQISEVDAPETSFNDTTAPWQEPKYYSVAAIITDIVQPRGAGDFGHRGLAAPENVSATDGTYTDIIAVSWDAVLYAETYRIYRDGAPVDIVDAPTTQYDDESVTPGVVYSYQVAAMMADGEGTKSEADTGRANAKPVAGLVADPPGGGVPLAVNFDASGSSDIDGSIVKYEWDWESDGFYDEDSATDPTEAHIYGDTGEYTATVRVSDNDGATDIETVVVLCSLIVTVDSAGNVGSYTSLTVVNGNPAISYYDATYTDLKYVGASDASGSSWSTPLTVDSTLKRGWHTSLAIVNGNPAIGYFYNSGHAAMYVRADDADGASWGVPKTVDGAGDTGQHTSLAVVNGNPAISYEDYTNGDLKYVRASDADGSSWGTSVIADSAGEVGRHTSLVVVNSRPAISYQDRTFGDLKYVRADDANGSEWGTPVTVDGGGGDNVGYYTSLAVVNGNPAVSYRDHTNGDLKYVRASDADGNNWGSPVTVDSEGDVGAYTSLAVVNGNPAISYYDETNGNLKYVWASDVDGSSWETPVIVDSAGDVGTYASLAVVNDHPAISYYDATNSDLKYAYLPVD